MAASLLYGRVALVAGATRGAGRATAVELGALGATVYCGGRSTRAGRSVLDRPETIEETAERVSAAGGTGVAVRCDHAVPDDVAALVERIRADHGRLDVLVNDVWGGDHFVTWGKALWEHPLEATLTVVRNGIETHLNTSHFAIPLLLASSEGLVVEVGDGRGRCAVPRQRRLRPSQDRRRAAGGGAGARARPVRRHGVERHSGLSAVGVDAGALMA
jgi:NAD(P)-dependent dehydrogenase (short-subunit alcohol dehydrogenase family)